MILSVTGGSRGTILIIDDQERSRSLYRTLLVREGYEVLEAEAAEQGLASVKSAKPDAVILDLFLPTLSGHEVLRRIRQDESTASIPVLILSVEGDEGAIKQALQLGAQDYLVKGFTPPKEVLSKLRVVMQRADLRKRIQSYRLHVMEGRADAARLEQDFGFSRLLQCPQCGVRLALELLPDYSRTDGTWFLAHFVCPKCGRAF